MLDKSSEMSQEIKCLNLHFPTRKKKFALKRLMYHLIWLEYEAAVIKSIKCLVCKMRFESTLFILSYKTPTNLKCSHKLFENIKFSDL